MAEGEVKRRLAAIVAGDVAGYSRLVSDDEEGTFASLRAHRAELIDPKIAEFNGRIANTAGDSILIEFPSVVEALRCCMDIQRAMAERNANVPEDRRIEIRVGINLGDVIEQDGDLLGAGVNVAARLEGLAEPGGICISRAARDQVRDLLDVTLEDMGEVEVKNIARPVRTFRVLPNGEPASSSRQSAFRKRIPALVAVLVIAVAAGAGLWWWQPWVERVEPARAERMAYPLPDEPSIAVLPFNNLSGDPAQEYFADGLTETIIGQLSKTPQLFVIARNSSFTYKNKPVKVQQVSEELGVRYVLEGSVQRSGGQVRVHAQLIDATTGKHIWSERYDRNATDIFTIQDDIAKNISATIDPFTGQIARAEWGRVQNKGTQNLEAWDHVRRSTAYWWKAKRDTNLLSREEAKKAIELDPNFARPYAFVGWTHLAEVWLGLTDTPKKSIAIAEEWARKAIALDQEEYQGYWLLAYVYIFSRRFDEAGVAFRKALQLNPNEAHVLYTYGLRYLVANGESDEAIAVMKKAMRRNPHHMERWFAALAVPLYLLGRYDEAIVNLKRVNKLRIDSRMLLAGSYAQLGQMEKAHKVIEQVLRERPDYSLEKFGRSMQFRKPEDALRWLEGPRKAGLPKKSPGETIVRP